MKLENLLVALKDTGVEKLYMFSTDYGDASTTCGINEVSEGLKKYFVKKFETTVGSDYAKIELSILKGGK